MKFDVPVVKKCLVECEQVYTVRKYETRDKFSVTEVNNIGSCMVEKIMQVESVDDLREFTPLSGFGSVYDWWDKVMQFNAVNGWLYHVTKLEDEFPSPLNVVEMTNEELEEISEMAFREEAARMWQQKENEDLAYEGEF